MNKTQRKMNTKIIYNFVVVVVVVDEADMKMFHIQLFIFVVF